MISDPLRVTVPQRNVANVAVVKRSDTDIPEAPESLRLCFDSSKIVKVVKLIFYCPTRTGLGFRSLISTISSVVGGAIF